jgi:hypothetical protein
MFPANSCSIQSEHISHSFTDVLFPVYPHMLHLAVAYFTGNGKGGHLDCTHSNGGDGLYGTHPYFVQAIIDDFFENQFF